MHRNTKRVASSLIRGTGHRQSTLSIARPLSSSTSEWKQPPEVGIVAMDVYFPSTYVNQTELEAFDGVSAGKYSIGLGQTNMAFCGDREDINSLSLNAVQRLVEQNGIDWKDIGRVEVGTETIVDKSKSVKTTLMDLFKQHGNTNIEGVDTTNACYGGTNALFNALHWVESSYWDGRYALVVAGDIAVYEPGPARPTGGAAAVAMLIGPKAPLAFDRGLRGTYMENAWDFYKPVMNSEYPAVDGPLSNTCYIHALDECFRLYSERFNKRFSKPFSTEKADFGLFHSPYTKLVQKSWARMAYLDAVNDKNHAQHSVLQSQNKLQPEKTYEDADLVKSFMKHSESSYKQKVSPSLLLPRELGNSYCASLYTGLLSLVDHIKHDKAAAAGDDKRALLFSYGSGLAATLFSLRIDPAGAAKIAEKADIRNRLQKRKRATPQEFVAALKSREETFDDAKQKPFVPTHSTKDLFPGAYYLAKVDEKHRRFYERVAGTL